VGGGKEGAEVKAMGVRGTTGRANRDPGAFGSPFTPGMGWRWQPDSGSHAPASWVFPMGRYDREPWKAGWADLFQRHEMVHNRRSTVRISVSAEGDGAFAVVDVDTLWWSKIDGTSFHWKGRACKGYAKAGPRWLLIYHTGLLEYRDQRPE